MKFKKLVSAVSALTVAAGCIAGMTITASAAEFSYSLTGVSRGNVSVDGASSTFVSASNAGNGYALAIADFSADTVDAGTITVSFDTNVPSGSRWNIGIGDKGTRGTNAAGSNKTNYIKDGLLMHFGTDNGTSFKVDSVASEVPFNTDLHITITLDKENSKYSYVIANADSTQNFASKTDVATDMTDLSILEVYSWANGSTITVSNIKVVTTDSVVPEVDYVVNYQLADGTTIKSVASKGFLNADIQTEEISFVENEKKYFVVSLPDDKKITANGEYTVIVREAVLCTGNINANIDGVYSKTLTSYSVYEGESGSYTYPKYLTDDNGKVIGVCDESSYGKSITPTVSEDYAVNYTAYTGTAYFVEAETKASLTNMTSNNLSSGTAIRNISGGIELLTVPESGIYKITYAGLASNVGEGKGGTLGIYVNDAIDTVSSVNVDWISVNKVLTDGTISVENVELSAGDVLKAIGTMSTTAIDYILIEKTGDVTPAAPEFSINLGEAYVSNGTEDFADQVATGYIATISNTGAEGTTTKVNVTVDAATKSAPVNVTLANGASVYIGMVLNNVDGNTQAVTATVE